MTQIISLIVLLCFITVIIAVGIFSAKKALTVDGFLLGGRKVGPWLSAFAYGTTYFSAVIFVGYAGMFGWTIGIGGVWIGIANAVLGCLLAWKVLAKPTWRLTHTLNARTIPELFEARYLSRGMKLYSAVIIFIFLVPYAAGVYRGLGTLFSSIFIGISPNVCIAIVAVLTGAYLVLGGYVATSLNDFIQGIIMIVGLIAMFAILITRPEVGGISSAVERLHSIDPNLTNIFGGANFAVLLPNILLTSFGVWGMPQMVHKYYAIKDENSIKIATIVSTLFALIIGCGAYLSGSLSKLFIAATETGAPALEGGYDAVIPAMLMQALSGGVLHNIVLGVILLLLLSASMSTLSSVVLSSSSAVSVDLMQGIMPDIKQKSQLSIMRVLCVLFIALSFIFATMNISFIVNLMSFSWGVVAGSFIGPFFWGLYGRWITKAGAWAGLLSGVIVVGGSLIYLSSGLGFDAAKAFAPQMGILAMAVSFVAVPAVSLFTKKFDSAHTDKVFSNNTSNVA
ncbi:MAG: sodium:solute symporter [Clostridiales Family XIII bacterium]|jgi:SSS family solute:Na+ symporter/sodium/proline symporter|nr:sodium:solute symporter [Clostridiales Family XIII bacterium]